MQLPNLENITLDTAYYWLVPVFTGLCVLWISRSRNSKKGLPLPPGPKGLPLVKNLFDIPTEKLHLTFAKWGKEHGDVIHVSALGRHIIVLNSMKAANDLLDQKSAIYSDRAHIPMLHDADLMNFEWGFAIKHYTKSWKRHRRLFIQHINPHTVSTLFAERQIAATLRFMNLLLDNPGNVDNLEHLVTHTMADIIIGITYGFDVKLENDALVHLATKMVNYVTEGTKPMFIVNLWPGVKRLPSWLPGFTYRAFAKQARVDSKRLIEEPFAEAVKRINSGIVTPSFVQTALTDSEKGDLEYLQDLKEVAAQMYGAGVDTAASAIQSLMVQLILQPEIQRRAQVHLDAVLGSPNSSTFRFPTFADRSSLPYIDALVKEILRFRPPTATGAPHTVTEDDEYRGWKIPKDAIIFANTWSLSFDETTYKNPHTFNPERFLGKDPEPTPVATFGFGRRICPGRGLAEASLWLLTACLLATFNISPAKDSKGKDIDVRYALESLPNAILRPPAFPFRATPRSKHVAKLIRDFNSH